MPLIPSQGLFFIDDLYQALAPLQIQTHALWGSLSPYGPKDLQSLGQRAKPR
ncbi:hypothetical protein [Limnohabitans sp. Rim8]|uniref:hypothetical protein n=1 Tax=Limnohabitans sp. Rim8 TaxID=1100718 RepID=UPI0026168CA3|nr:hypothetical protein [Limnohabitans sp. Rim8]